MLPSGFRSLQDWNLLWNLLSGGLSVGLVCYNDTTHFDITHSIMEHVLSHVRPLLFDPRSCALTCVFSGFTASLYDGDGWSCQSIVQTPTTALLDDGTPVSITSKVLMADWPIFIAWESADFDKFTPKAAPLLKAAPSAPTSSSAFTPSRTSTPSPTQTRLHNATPVSKQRSDGGLSVGAEAGIGVGAAAIVLAAAAFVVLYFVRRKRRRQEPSGYSAAEFQYKQAPSELDGVVRYEAHGAAKPAELHRSPIVAELSADWHR